MMYTSFRSGNYPFTTGKISLLFLHLTFKQIYANALVHSKLCPHQAA